MIQREWTRAVLVLLKPVAQEDPSRSLSPRAPLSVLCLKSHLEKYIFSQILHTIGDTEFLLKGIYRAQCIREG